MQRMATVVVVALFVVASSGLAQHMNAPNAPCRNVAVTVDVANCFSEEGKKADTEMNRLYQSILKGLEPEDASRLRDAQRQWLHYRDANCNAEKGLYGSGTGASPAYLACIQSVTQARIAELKTIYDWKMQK
jgi:uncharacterized protein YecT (DUF1311 family)